MGPHGAAAAARHPPPLAQALRPRVLPLRPPLAPPQRWLSGPLRGRARGRGRAVVRARHSGAALRACWGGLGAYVDVQCACCRLQVDADQHRQFVALLRQSHVMPFVPLQPHSSGGGAETFAVLQPIDGIAPSALACFAAAHERRSAHVGWGSAEHSPESSGTEALRPHDPRKAADAPLDQVRGSGRCCSSRADLVLRGLECGAPCAGGGNGVAGARGAAER